MYNLHFYFSPSLHSGNPATDDATDNIPAKNDADTTTF